MKGELVVRKPDTERDLFDFWQETISLRERLEEQIKGGMKLVLVGLALSGLSSLSFWLLGFLGFIPLIFALSILAGGLYLWLDPLIKHNDAEQSIMNESKEWERAAYFNYCQWIQCH